MFSKWTSLDEMKRIMYLCTSPFAIFALLIYNFVQPETGDKQFYFVMNRILITWLLVSWIILYKKLLFRFVELSNLILISILFVVSIYDSIYNYMVPGREGALGVFFMWVPLIFIYFFLSLKGKSGFFYSIGVFGITLTFGALNFWRISHTYILTLINFYVSSLVYIVFFYFVRYLFRLFTELEVAKRNAFIDFLTGIANRHQIDMWIKSNMEKSKNHKFPFSIIFFDLDHFKVINDTFGHKVGDMVLKEITSLVKGKLAKNEFFGRWGGEEFIIVMNQTEENAMKLAELLRNNIKNYNFSVAGKQTASFGVTGIREDDTVDSIVNRADKALYESKAFGRDRVTLL